MTNEAPTSPPPPAQTDPPRQAILIKVKPPHMFVWGDAAVVFANMLHAAIVHALLDKDTLCVDQPSAANGFRRPYAANVAARGAQAFGVFEVSDLRMGLETIRRELASLEALNASEIGWLDFREGFWRGWYPSDAKEPFQNNVDLLKSWFVRPRH